MVSLTHRLGDDEKHILNRFLDLAESLIGRSGGHRIYFDGDEKLAALFDRALTLGERAVDLLGRGRQKLPYVYYEGDFLMLFKLPSTFPNTRINLILPTEVRDAENYPIPVSEIGVRLVSNNDSAVKINLDTGDPLVNEVVIVGPHDDGSPNSAAVNLEIFMKDSGLGVTSVAGCVVEVSHGAPVSSLGGGADFSPFGAPVEEAPPPVLTGSGSGLGSQSTDAGPTSSGPGGPTGTEQAGASAASEDTKPLE